MACDPNWGHWYHLPSLYNQKSLASWTMPSLGATRSHLHFLSQEKVVSQMLRLPFGCCSALEEIKVESQPLRLLPCKCEKLKDNLIALQKVSFFPLGAEVHGVRRIHNLGGLLVAIQDLGKPRGVQASKRSPCEGSARAEGQQPFDLGGDHLPPEALNLNVPEHVWENHLIKCCRKMVERSR